MWSTWIGRNFYSAPPQGTVAPGPVVTPGSGAPVVPPSGQGASPPPQAAATTSATGSLGVQAVPFVANLGTEPQAKPFSPGGGSAPGSVPLAVPFSPAGKARSRQ